MRRALAKLLRRTIMVILGLVAAGYLSNLVSRDSCEAYGMKEIVDSVRLLDGTTERVFVLPRHSPRAEIVLRKAGLALRPCVDPPEKFRCFPWADVDSKIFVPFFVWVRWEHVAFPTSGGGSSATFFCLFGFRWLVEEHGMWVT